MTYNEDVPEFPFNFVELSLDDALPFADAVDEGFTTKNTIKIAIQTTKTIPVAMQRQLSMINDDEFIDEPLL